MKTRYITTIMTWLLTLTAATAQAQESTQPYYYYRDKKIYIENDPSRLAVIAQPMDGKDIPQIEGYELTGRQDNLTTTTYSYKKSVFSSSTPTPDVEALFGKEAFVQPCYKDENGRPIALSDQLLVALKTPADTVKLTHVCKMFNMKIVEHSSLLPRWYTLAITSLTGTDVVNMARILKESGWFDGAQPAFTGEVQGSGISGDPYTNYLWGLYNVENPGTDTAASAAWSYATGQGVRVAVMDTGADLTHDDLKDNADAESYDARKLVSPNTTYYDHATEISGIISATKDNSIGVCGIAPDAKIMSVRGGEGSTVECISTAKGIMWAWKHGADVINCSWGFSSYIESIAEAIDSALVFGRDGLGCVVVVSCGNKDEVLFPANSNNKLIRVNSIKNNGEIAEANCGKSENIDIVAPGERILTTSLNNGYKYVSGTSCAAAFVSGIAALILERNPFLSYQQVKDIIESTAQKLGNADYYNVQNRPNGTWNNSFGYGLVNAYDAVMATPRLN